MIMAVVESPAPKSLIPPSPPKSPYCVELPEDVVDKIAELDLELSEGDITQKGYEKKKNKLLAPFLKPTPPNPTTPAPSQQARGGAGGEGGGGGGNGEVVVRDLTRDQVVRDLSEDG